ncbi:MAG: response regulator [Spirochaetota bacterium]|nr:response regulator [Spirochaetota bacterium]
MKSTDSIQPDFSAWTLFLIDETGINLTRMGRITELSESSLSIQQLESVPPENQEFHCKLISPQEIYMAPLELTLKHKENQSEPRQDSGSQTYSIIELSNPDRQTIQQHITERNLFITNSQYRILVVDDSKLIRKAIEYRLRGLGYTVMALDNGFEAMDILHREDFDLVLSDIVMPNMDGYQLLELIKRDESTKYIPVIMLSGVEEVDSVVKCIKMGAEDYFVKHPFKVEFLKARVSASLDKKRLRDREQQAQRDLDREKKKSDALLHVMLPAEIVKELKETGRVEPQRHEKVAVLFCDIVGFTSFCDKNEPEVVVTKLEQVVEAFEELADFFGLYKIKTIGDAFMAVGGLVKPLDNPVAKCVECGLVMIKAVQNVDWQARIGVHVGPLIAGVIGKQNYLFDVWGDTVNTAARVESNGINGGVSLSRVAWEEVSNMFIGESKGHIQAKGKGELEIFQAFGLKNP